MPTRAMASSESELLGPLLRDVSRSFYKTLKLLPGSIRKQISLAYLLARTTDTIADTELVPPTQRLEALQQLRERILGSRPGPLNFHELSRQQASRAEASLLEHSEASLALLETLSESDRALVRTVLEIITGGQELDVKRFAGATAARPAALQTDDDLEDYTFRVAGCVGEFWTRVCLAHVFPAAAIDRGWLIENGIRFGKGLQLINILRDLPLDLRKGRCYLPASGLTGLGLQPGDLLEPKTESRFRPLYNHWLDRAHSHLVAGWSYTKTLPWNAMRVRVACAIPILIGADTLALLRKGQILNPEPRLKVSRDQVKRSFRRLVLLYPFRRAWERLGPAQG